MKYNHRLIEKKWQKVWARGGYKIWQAKDLDRRPKQYVLDMFPYPSGEGLHVGHLLGYVGSDILARYYRMRGFNVLHPMGWDAFGLPAENYAIKNKIHPSVAVRRNIKHFKAQLNAPGFSYDWSREINTTDSNYYKWTQWIFLQMFKRGLAYEADLPVNWCPSDKTVLANEEVIDGACVRCGAKVEHKNLKQWVLKITAYADRLLEDLALLDWPEKVKELQKNWIGRSEGALIKFPVVIARSETTKQSYNNVRLPRPVSGARNDGIEVFTTRPDTLAGATYIVLAPEHPFVAAVIASSGATKSPYGGSPAGRQSCNIVENYEEIKKYIEAACNKSDLERMIGETPTPVKDGVGAPTAERVGGKTGVELKGIKVINPWNGIELPVWISDYVLAYYGTGAIMAVPRHDDRDREFAIKFKLPIVDEPLLDKEAVIKKVGGQKTTNYKLRDWIFSRQRYWGEPIPIVKCEKCGVVPVPEKDLPVELPKVKSYEPTGTGESPLANVKKWVEIKCPQCGGKARRETNTMPQWAGSCWYYLGYLLGKGNPSTLRQAQGKLSSGAIVAERSRSTTLDLRKFKAVFDYWLPVDLYIGGVEHAVLHLLYARFWHKFLYDIGVVGTKEPFQKLMNQGLMAGPDGQKMSKSRGNVVSPDEMIEKFGADAMRVYEMFMGPFENGKSWDPHGIVGVRRFLERLWHFILKNSRIKISDEKALRALHRIIKKVTGDIEQFHFNTAVSALMIFLNEAETLALSRADLLSLLKIISPFAPHLAQELASQLGYKKLLDFEVWPAWDENLVAEATFELIVQINGKTRGKVVADFGLDEAAAKELALHDPAIAKWLGGAEIKKVIFVKNRLINLIV